MNYEQTVTLIHRLEEYAASNPRSYEYKVLGLTALGYAYFVGLVLMFLIPPLVIIMGLIFAPEETFRILLLTLKLWWLVLPGIGIFFGFIGGAVKAMTAKVPEPPGMPLTAEQAPELFEFIRETSLALSSRMPDQVLVTDDFNAAVVTLPRFGIFGRKVFLLVGLPLMQALSLEQFKAVVVHEIGHISGKHGAFAKWAYQVGDAWEKFIDAQELSEHKFDTLYKKFVNWYFPYFTAYSFVLMRNHEREADQNAVQLVGATAVGESLISIWTREAEVQATFWKDIHEENLKADTPSERMFSRMLGALAFVDPLRARETLTKALEIPTDYGDTHPSLADRLREIGYWNGLQVPPVPEPPRLTAADHFVGSSMDGFVTAFDSVWEEQAAIQWKSRHEHFQQSQKRIDELDAKSEEGDLTAEEAVEAAMRISEMGNTEAALPLLEAAAEKFPESSLVWYNLGCTRLALDDEQGLTDLERAVEFDKTYKLVSSESSFQFLRSKGRLEEAKKHADGAEKQYEMLEQAKKERSVVLPTDQFEVHTLPQAIIDMVPVKLSRFEEITAIYLVRKRVELLPEIPMHVMFLETRPSGRFKNSGDLKTNDILNIAADRFNGPDINFFAVLVGTFAALKPPLEKIDGAKVFDRYTWQLQKDAVELRNSEEAIK